MGWLPIKKPTNTQLRVGAARPQHHLPPASEVEPLLKLDLNCEFVLNGLVVTWNIIYWVTRVAESAGLTFGLWAPQTDRCQKCSAASLNKPAFG